MSGCCGEVGCRRKKPMMLARGGLSGIWYIATDYTDEGGGVIAIKQKHRVNEAQTKQLNEAFGSLDDEE